MCQVNLLVEWMDGNEYQVCQNQYLSVLAEKNYSRCHLEETIHDFLLVGKWHECAGHIYGTLEGKWKSEELSKEAYSYKGFYSSPCSGWNSWVAPLWEMGEDWVVKWACGCSGGNWIWATWVHCIGVYRRKCVGTQCLTRHLSPSLYFGL